ncbi:MAG: translation initiation factor IF-2 [Proteobacteria bacterium]|nr:translation initiation factor IF-2 [Pseudomonadota bacterium]
MTAKDKIRIYDLARDSVPAAITDARIQKKIQSEITRRILECAPKYGSFPKTASSCIDGAVIQNILDEVNINSIINEFVGEVSSNVLASAGAVRSSSSSHRSVDKSAKPDEEIVQKKKLIIVRRMVSTPDPLLSEDKAPEVSSVSDSYAEINKMKTDNMALDVVHAASLPSSQDDVSDLTEPSSVNQVPTEDSSTAESEVLSDFVNSLSVNNLQKPSLDRATKSIDDISNVRSLSLNPSANRQATQQQQPYRVAAPTLRVQGKKGLGRAKKTTVQDNKFNKKLKFKSQEPEEEVVKIFNVANSMTVRELSHKIEIPETQIITYFFMRKIIKTVNDIVEKDLIIQYLESIGYLVSTDEEETLTNEELIDTLKEDETEGNLITRPPVVTIMGHVDHGKTTLIDCLRNYSRKIVDQEFGGITQHINAYQVTAEDYDGNKRVITFIDTPGHEAFTAMRRRGANITDIVVLVVAADDGINTQTKECIKHIRESKVPYLVAINKIDKPDANIDRVLAQLADYGIVTEQYGGPISCAQISALKKLNIAELLEKIILVADAELSDEIRSNPNRPAVGSVIEAEMSRHKGSMATILVQNGTLRIGDFIAAGAVSGRVKAMFNENNEALKTAGPSTPLKLLGLSGVPKAGDPIKVYPSIQEAKRVSEIEREKELDEKRFKGISSFASEIKEGQAKEMRIIIKADVQGSAEAIASELNKLSTEEVLVKPVLFESGSITANDVQLAEATGAMLVGFHIGTDSQTAKLAEKLKVKIRSYEVIYKLIEDVGRAVLGLHEPDLEQRDLGQAEVRRIFTMDKRNIAGCYVLNGEVTRNEKARVLRDGVQIYEGKLDYLKRFKDDVKSVKEGFECGISFERYNDLQEGDVILCYTIKEVARTA